MNVQMHEIRTCADSKRADAWKNWIDYTQASAWKVILVKEEKKDID